MTTTTTPETNTATALSRTDRYQPLWLLASIGVGLLLARAIPALAGSLDILVSAGVLVLIFLVMLGLDVSRIKESLSERRFLSLAIGLNFIINPLLAWGLGEVFLGGQADLRVGLLLFLVTPCIGWYLIFTELAGGDAGLGVSLLGLNLLLQVLLLPLYLLLFEGRATGIEFGGVITSVALFLVIPALAAGTLQHVLPIRGVDLSKVRQSVNNAHLKTAALVIVIISMFASQGEVVFDNPGVVLRLLAPMTAFFAITFLVALVVGRWARLPYEQTALLAFTTTSRNSEASLAIAVTAFASPLVALTVVIGPIIELPLLVLMVRALLGLRPPTERAPR